MTLNDHRIFDFREYFRLFSEAIFPLFVWSVMMYRNGNYPKFTITDFNRIADPGGFNVMSPGPSIENVKRKVRTKINELQRQYPDAKEEYLATKDSIKASRRCVTCCDRSGKQRSAMPELIRPRSRMR